MTYICRFSLGLGLKFWFKLEFVQAYIRSELSSLKDISVQDRVSRSRDTLERAYKWVNI